MKYITSPITPFTNHHLDWINKSELLSNLDLFNLAEQIMIAQAHQKETYYGHDFRGGNYFENIYPLIASRFPYAPRILYCGRTNEGNPSGRCEKWKLCSRCANLRKWRALCNYLPSFNHNSFISLTIAFKKTVKLKEKDSFSRVTDHWNAINYAIKCLKDNHRILGAYYGEESYITRFSPLRLHPHAHCVLHVEKERSIDLAEITDYLNEFQSESGIKLDPSINLKSVVNQFHFANALKYSTKPIHFVPQYRKAIHSNRDDLSRIKNINREFRKFLLGWTESMKGRTAVRKVGTMHHSSSNYIGPRDSHEKREAKEYVKSFLDELHEKAMRRITELSKTNTKESIRRNT